MVSSPAKPGMTPFGPSRETREEVGFDEAGNDAHISLQVVPIDPDWHSCRGGTEPGQHRSVGRVVIDDRHGRDDLLAKHLREFLVGHRTVRAVADKDDELLTRNPIQASRAATAPEGGWAWDVLGPR